MVLRRLGQKLSRRAVPAIERFARAMRLSPLDPFAVGMRGGTAYAHFLLGHYDEVVNGRQWHCRTIRTINLDYASPPQAMQWPDGRKQAHKAMARAAATHPALRVSTLKDLVGPWRAEDLSAIRRRIAASRAARNPRSQVLEPGDVVNKKGRDFRLWHEPDATGPVWRCPSLRVDRSRLARVNRRD